MSNKIGTIQGIHNSRNQLSMAVLAMRSRVIADLRLAEATKELLCLIQDRIGEDSEFPVMCPTAETPPPVALSRDVWQLRRQLRSLANTYGFTIIEHPTLRHYGSLAVVYDDGSCSGEAGSDEA